MNRGSRGAALVEVALTVGIVLTLLLGTVQIGVVGFKQTAQDGAAFVAARTYAQDAASGISRATIAASSVFDTVASNAIAIVPAAGTVTATVSGTASAPSVPGAPSVIGLQSGATERIRTTGTAGAFSASGTLSNFRDASGTALATHPLVLAQPALPRRSGNCDQTGGDEGCDGEHEYSGPGYSGPSAEWDCRLAAYGGVAFPSTRPHGSGTGSGTAWDPASSGSAFNAIYRWDGGSSCY